MTTKQERREQIIHDMCLTWRHDYGLRLTESQREQGFPYLSGMTDLERRSLFMSMSQIFEHHIEPILRERDELMNGERVPLPKSETHAKAMLLLAQQYLDNNS